MSTHTPHPLDSSSGLDGLSAEQKAETASLGEWIAGAIETTNCVMGSTSDTSSAASERASGIASDVGDRTHEAASAVKQRARGNPLAAALIALGAGWLLGSLPPASEKERELSETVKEKAAPVVESAQSTAKDVASEAGEPLRAPRFGGRGRRQGAGTGVCGERQARGPAGDVRRSGQRRRVCERGARAV